MELRAPFRACLLMAAAVLGACGQKGPLYLPEPTGEVVTRPTQTTPAPATQSPPTEPAPPAEQADPSPPDRTPPRP